MYIMLSGEMPTPLYLVKIWINTNPAMAAIEASACLVAKLRMAETAVINNKTLKNHFRFLPLFIITQHNRPIRIKTEYTPILKPSLIAEPMTAKQLFKLMDTKSNSR